MHSIVFPLLTTCALAGGIVAQADCSTNLIVNGDFEQSSPAWTQTGGTGSFSITTADVNGDGNATRCALVQGTCILRAPKPFHLGPPPSRLSLDVNAGLGTLNVRFVLINPTGWRTTLRDLALANGSRQHLELGFTDFFGGFFPGSLEIELRASQGCYIDNVRVTTAPTKLAFSASGLQRNTTVNYEISGGTPNGSVVLLVAKNAAQPVKIPGWKGALMIGPGRGIVVLGPMRLDAGGSYYGSFFMPSGTRHAALHWQPVQISGPKWIGCSTRLAFN